MEKEIIQRIKDEHVIIQSIKTITDYDESKEEVLEVVIRPHEFFGNVLRVITEIVNYYNMCFIEEVRDVEFDLYGKSDIVDIYYFKKK